MARQQPKSICILRLSAIGDVCHMVAVVQLLQRQWPDAKITWIIGKTEASLLAGLPGVEFIVFDKNAGFKAYRELWQAMRGRRFDIFLHMQMALRASLASLCIQATLRLGFDKVRAKDMQWLFVNERIAAQTEPHVIEGFRRFAEYFDITDTALTWDVPIAPADQAWANNIINGCDTLVIAPASSVSYRNWTTEGYAAVASYAIEKHGLQVVVAGGNTALEQTIAEAIVTNTDGKAVNLVGKTNLKQLLALLKQAKVLIAPDTGPAHMATMVGTPVIGLYACTNPRRAAAFNSQQYVVNYYEQALKQFCNKSMSEVAFGKRVKTNKAMQLIPVTAVIGMLDTVLHE